MLFPVLKKVKFNFNDVKIYNVRHHDDIYNYAMTKKNEISFRNKKKLHYFINIFVINQVTIKLSTYGTIAGSDRSANNQCEGLFSGLRDLDTSFSRLLLNIHCLHVAGVRGRIDTRAE